MASSNPYGLKVELSPESMEVKVTVREKASDGEFTELDSRAFPSDLIHSSLKDMVLLYGYSKLLQDRASSTPAGPEKLDAMNEIAESLIEGNWERERKSGGPTVSIEVQALASLKGVDVRTIQQTLGRLSKEQREEILSNPRVTEAADAIRAADSQAEDIDLTDMLSA